MVKLFVGNLADAVDSHRLKNLFSQYVQVQECDVLKNFAFIHVGNETDADIAIQKLDKYRLEGKEIHIERSTSRLRKEPGMGDKCFTCGALDHKTPQCPHEGQNRKTANKRPGGIPEEDHTKRFVLSNPATNYSPNTQPKCWGYSLVPAAEQVDPASLDPELPCPLNPELKTLYDQYMESRTRYFFYRERLTKELKLVGQHVTGTIPPVPSATSVASSVGTNGQNLGRLDLTSANRGQLSQIGAGAFSSLTPCSPLSSYGYGLDTNIQEAKYIPSQYNGTPSATYSALPTTYAAANPPSAPSNYYAYSQPATSYPSWSNNTSNSSEIKFKRSPKFYNNLSPQ